MDSTTSDRTVTSIDGSVMDADDETRTADLMVLVAQEMRGPLTAVKGHTQRLLMSWDTLDDGGKLAMLERINTSVSRLRRLVEDIGLISGGYGGQLTLLSHPFLLEPVIQQAIAEIGARQGDRAAAIMPAGNNVAMYGDQYRLEQVLIILLELAVLRAPQDTPIEVLYGRDEAHAYIAIADLGTMLSAVDWSALLEHGRPPRESAGTAWEGLALNLLVATRIAHAMGGRVTGTSSGELSRVTLELPIAETE